MKPIVTIGKNDIESCDLLFYRPSSLFWLMIKFFDSLRYGRLDIAFSHVAIAIPDATGAIKRFDAMEWYRTGFRDDFENCYIFKLDLSEKEKQGIIHHCLSRGGSRYDKKGIFSFFSPIEEDEFCDYCSELVKNSLYYSQYWDILLLGDKKLSPLKLYLTLRPYLTFKGLLIW